MNVFEKLKKGEPVSMMSEEYNVTMSPGTPLTI